MIYLYGTPYFMVCCFLPSSKYLATVCKLIWMTTYKIISLFGYVKNFPVRVFEENVKNKWWWSILFLINNTNHLLISFIKISWAGKIFNYVRSLTSKHALGDNTYKSLDPLWLTHKKGRQDKIIFVSFCYIWFWNGECVW